MAARLNFLELGKAVTQSRTTEESGIVSVWLVDDDESFRDLLANLLRLQEGVTCDRQFGSAESLLAALAQEPGPDVILLDVQMSGLNGIDAIRPIKRLAAHTQVLMLTAFYDSQRRAHALREGATDFLVKIDTVEKISRQIRQSRIPWEEEDTLRRSACEDAEDPVPAGSVHGESSLWPSRRASAQRTEACDHSEVTQEHPELGRRSMLWHDASGWLVRGVAFVTALMGWAAQKGGDA